MRYRIHHLLYVATVFACSLALDFPGSLIVKERPWRVDSAHQKTTSGRSVADLHPWTNVAGQDSHRDLVLTLKAGASFRTINLGNSAMLALHELPLPKIGSYVTIRNRSQMRHGQLPVATVDPPGVFQEGLVLMVSLFASVALVAGFLTFRRCGSRMIMLRNERKELDRALKALAKN